MKLVSTHLPNAVEIAARVVSFFSNFVITMGWIGHRDIDLGPALEADQCLILDRFLCWIYP